MAKVFGILVERADGAGYEWEYEPINEGPQIVRDKSGKQFVEIIDSFLRVDKEGRVTLAKEHMIANPDEMLSWYQALEVEAPEIAAYIRETTIRLVNDAGGLEAIRASYEAHADKQC